MSLDAHDVAEVGGGGYGDPRHRDRLLVERDLREGYISEQAAAIEYG